jgi:transposase
VNCIQKEEEIRTDKYNNHHTIIRIPDKLWNETQMILHKEKLSGTIGRPVIPYRKVLDGIIYVLRTGYQWKILPKEHGLNSTCHRRFQEWDRLDIFKKTWIRLLKIYDTTNGIDWTWHPFDSISIKSPLVGNDWK